MSSPGRTQPPAAWEIPGNRKSPSGRVRSPGDILPAGNALRLPRKHTDLEALRFVDCFFLADQWRHQTFFEIPAPGPASESLWAHLWNSGISLESRAIAARPVHKNDPRTLPRQL